MNYLDKLHKFGGDFISDLEDIRTIPLTEEKNIYFLIDASGSMAATMYGEKESPLDVALYNAYVATRAAQERKDSKLSVTTILFGDNSSLPKMVTSRLPTVEVQSFFNASGDGPRSYSYLENELDTLSNMMAVQGKNQGAELIILTDGGLDNSDCTKRKLVALKEKYPNLNINISLIAISNFGTGLDMQFLADKLKKEGVYVNFQTIDNKSILTLGIKDMLVSKSKKEPELNFVRTAIIEIQDDFNALSQKITKLKEQLKSGNFKKHSGKFGL